MMRLKSAIIILFFLSILVTVTVASVDPNKGARNIVLEGGKSGIVNFPHHLHQENIKDCNVCHDLFPQEAGGIQDLKNQGKLEKKQVMNKKCLKCHRAKKKAGEKSGPTKCKECHLN